MEINVLKKTAKPLTTLLTGKKIPVTFKGTSAYTMYDENGNTTGIVLPIVDGKTEKRIINALHGYLDHEVAHVLFSDMKGGLFKKLQNGKYTVKALFNLIEDPRVETLIEKQYRGSKYNLGNLHEFVWDDDYMNDIECSGDESSITFTGAIVAARAAFDQPHFVELSNKRTKIAKVAQEILGHFGAEAFTSLQSSGETFDFAVKVDEYLKDRLKEPEPNEGGEGDSDQEQDDDQSENSESSSGGQSQNEEQGDSKSKSADSKSDDSKKDEEQKDQSKSKSKGKKSSKKEEHKDEKSNDKQKARKGNKERKKLEDSDITDTSDDAHEWIRPEQANEIYDNHIKRRFKFKQSQVMSGGYLIDTTENDLVEHIVEAVSDFGVEQMKENTQSMAGTIQKQLERAMSARSISQYTTGYRRGKLHNATLAKLVLGDDRVFRRKEVQINKDVAVSLLIDCSGSMTSERKAQLAATAAYALAEVLQRMQIACELIGFTTQGSYGRATDLARQAGIYMPIFKSFNDPWDIKAKRRLAKLWNEGWLANNVDGECVQIAANRLMARTETKKILIVLSDGQPNADGRTIMLQQHLKDTVKELSTKINIVGVGIKSEAVKRYYPKHVVLRSIDELPTEVIRQIRALLLS